MFNTQSTDFFSGFFLLFIFFFCNAPIFIYSKIKIIMSERIHLQNYYTETEGRKPNANDIEKGEIAINTADEILFMKNKNNGITEFIDKNAIQALIDENKIYLFNPEGTPSEEYAGLQDAVNNGKTVVTWTEDGGTSPVVCTVVYGFYTQGAYCVMFSQATTLNNEGTIFYYSVNVSETSIDVIGNIASPIITGVDDALNIDSTNPVQNKVILEALGTVAEQANNKQAQLVSGTNIKTINGQSLLGSGNIAIETNITDIYTLTSFTKSQLDSFTSGSSISISSTDFNVISSNTKIICINNGGNGGKCIMVGWNVQSSSVAQLTFLCDNVIYVCKVNINTNSANGTIGEVSKHLVGVGEDPSTSPFYITDFTLDNLRSSSSEQAYYSCDAAAVCAALDERKIILVPVFDGAIGYVVAKVYYEDLLYWTIYDESLLQVFTFEMGVTQIDIESTSVTTNVLATQSYVDDAVANSDYTITSFTKATLDNANNTSNVNAITISTADYNAITANTKTIYINNGGSGGRCILSGWNVISSTLARLEFLCDGLTYVCDVTISGTTAKITSVKKIGNMRNVTHSSLTIYANETYYWNDSDYDNVTFSLQAPTNTSIANVFTVIIKNIAGTESAISFYTPNNTIVWANDNPPVLGGSDGGDTYGNYVEISIRYIDNKYLGTWTKFSAS